MVTMPDVKPVKYVRPDGLEKTANIIPVSFSTDGLSQEELEILDNISNAVDHITPVYAQQQDARNFEMLRALKDLEGRIDPEQRAKLDDFITLFVVRNAPYDFFDLSAKFPINLDKIHADHPIRAYPELLAGDFKIPKGRNLYPSDITDEEFENLDDKLIENSTVIRLANRDLKVVLNEERFEQELKPIIEYLIKAKFVSTNPNLNSYIEAKIHELRTGSPESRRKSDLTWLKNSGAIDFTLGTAVETYLDKFKGVRSTAQGAVFTIDEKYKSISSKLLKLLPQWEAQASWKYKKEVDMSSLPKLNYVNVFNWAGDYNSFPMCVVAQSLPNDREVIEKYGSVNMVFANIWKARAKVGTAFIAEEFFLKSEREKYLSYMSDMTLILIAAHELGHTTGGSKVKEPKKHFGKEYTRFEESRAELFSLWVLPSLVKKGVISPEQEVAGYYIMLESIVKAMENKPEDHIGARNMMFHYFIKNGAVVEREEDGKSKYLINPEKMRPAVRKMLATIGDIKAEGDLEGLKKFKEEYISTAKQEYFKKRLEKMPSGIGLIFPTLEYDNGRYTGNLIYPATFREQKRTLEYFI